MPKGYTNDGSLPWNRLPDSQGVYLPNEMEIEAACRIIRNGWSHEETVRRSRGYLEDGAFEIHSRRFLLGGVSI